MELLEIERFEDQDKLALFRAVAHEVYQKDRIWVSHSEDAFIQRFQAAQELGIPWMRPVICLDGGRAVARAAAIYSPGAADSYNLPQGYIGFFECLREAAGAGQRVLEYCEQLLRTQGARSVQAPRSDNMLMGLLVKGFDLSQTVLTPYNPPYYPEILLMQGYDASEHLYCYLFGRESLLNYNLQLPGFHTRTFRRDQLEEEIHIFNHLQAEIFRGHPGYIPRNLSEDRAMIESFLPMLVDELIILAEDSSNRPVGITVCLPDIYQAFHGQPVDTARLISIGVIPELTTHGIGVLMGLHLAHNLDKMGFSYLEASWIRENNILPHLMAKRFKGKPGREFVLFEKRLDDRTQGGR